MSWRRVLGFYAATFALTHVATTLYRLAGGSWRSMDAFVIANGISLIPGLTALVFARFVLRQPVRATLGLSLRVNNWWIAAWLLPAALMVATLAVSLLLPGTSYRPDMSGLGARLGLADVEIVRLRAHLQAFGRSPFWTLLLQGLALGPTLGLLGGLGEELGWRGLLHHELRGLGFWRCSLVTGLLWGLWHVPLTLQGYGYPRHPVAGTLVFLVYVLLFAPLLTHVRQRAGSVLAAAVLHGTANMTVMLTLALVSGGSDLTTGWGSLSCVAVLALANLILLAVRRAPAATLSPALPSRGALQ